MTCAPEQRLRRASFRGIPFEVESDAISDRVRITSHEVPRRRDPLNENLDLGAVEIEVEAYLVGEAWAAGVDALRAAMRNGEPGLLVLPLGGPRLVRPKTCKRDFRRDRLGKTGFSLTFVEEGAQEPAGSALSLANLVHVAIGALSTAAAGLAAARIDPAAPTTLAEASAAAALAAPVEALESVRLSTPSTGADAAGVALTVAASLAVSSSRSAPGRREIAARAFEAASALAAGMDAGAAGLAFLPLADAPVPPRRDTGISAGARVAERHAEAGALLTRAAGLAALAEAFVARTFASRDDAVTALARIVAAADGTAGPIGADDPSQCYRAVIALRDACVAYAHRAMTDLKPVVTVRGPRRMPSLVWAWRLYGDAARGPELAARNAVSRPALMPEIFTALAA